MGFAVEMYFDRQAEERIGMLWEELASRGIDCLLPAVGSRPHISLAVFEQIDLDRMQEEVERFAARQRPVPLTLSSVGVFPTPEGVVFLAPVVTPELLEAHRRFHERIEATRSRSRDHYLPGQWVPHCTIATSLTHDRVPLTLEICGRSRAFGPLVLTEVGLVEFRPVREMGTYALRGHRR